MGRKSINSIMDKLKFPQYRNVTIDGEIWEDENLSIVDALIYQMMCELSYEFKGSIVTTKKSLLNTFHCYLDMSTKTVERSIKKLINLKYLYIINDDEAKQRNLIRISVNKIIDDMDSYISVCQEDEVDYWMIDYIKDECIKNYWKENL